MSSRQTEALWRTAQALARVHAARKPDAWTGRAPPPLLLFTDPERMPDPVAAAAELPAGAGVVFRHFGRPDAESVATALARLAREKPLTLLIGDDVGLALSVGAGGVHLPERGLSAAVVRMCRHRELLVTAAAHSPAALRRADRLSLDAAILSPVFPSRSASAGSPLGVLRAAAMATAVRLPVYALGGVQARSSRRLAGTHLAGLAAVEALSR